MFTDCITKFTECSSLRRRLYIQHKVNIYEILCGFLCSRSTSDFYSSPNNVRVIKSRIMRWAGHVARMGKERGVYRVLVGKPEGRRPLGRPRLRWVDNVRMDLQVVGCGYMD